MCGRFAQYSSLSSLKKTLTIDKVTCDMTPSYNVAPTQEVLAVLHHEGNRLGKLHWGLVPQWANDLSMAPKMINARAETLSEKPAFRNAYKNRRCVIPADGFYEWEKQKKGKRPMYFTLPSKEPFVFAGLWETWKGDTDENYYSCTIITADAVGPIQKIHHRMPVILTPEAVESWLDPLMKDTEKLNEILRTGHVPDVEGIIVSEFVNSVKNNGSSCIEPAEKKY